MKLVYIVNVGIERIEHLRPHLVIFLKLLKFIYVTFINVYSFKLNA